LLKAAEELGIDLSPAVARVAAAEVAAEALEGAAPDADEPVEAVEAAGDDDAEDDDGDVLPAGDFEDEAADVEIEVEVED